ncbi:MAG: histidinol-phosphatase HisJ family protein [Christensenellaceae bacterium]
MVDYHVHSNVSFDAYTDMVDCAVYARDIGLDEICFTEHHEIDYPYPDAKPEYDYELYNRQIERVRREVPEIIIKRGVEVGLIPTSIQKISDDLKDKEFDFIIASQHAVGGKDPWWGDFFDGKTVREGQREYLQEILKCISLFDHYDVIGHIGYIDKYLKKSNTQKDEAPFQYHDFPELIDELLKKVIDAGKGIEVNTSNYYIYGYPTPHKSILKRYVELGGEILTMGSDAHSAEVIGHCFLQAQELIKECGAKYICTFTQRKPTFIKL